MNERKRDFCVGIFISLLMLITWAIYTKCDKTGKYNVLFYLIISIAFILAGLILRKIIDGRKLPFLDKPQVAYSVALVIFSMVLGILLWNYKIENDVFGSNGILCIRHNISAYLYFTFIVVFIIVCRNIRVSFNFRIRYLIAGLCSCITAMNAYILNPFYDRGGKVLHYDAYTTTIFNVLHKAPFSNIHMPVYGHYSIIYYPFVKLFGGGVEGVQIAILFFAFLTFLFMSLAGAKLIKNDSIFLLYEFGLLITTSMLNVLGSYLQIFPHRCFFPALMIYFCTCSQSMKQKYWELIGWVINIFAIIWNLEIGIVCAISWLVCLVMIKEKSYLKDKNRGIAIICLGIVEGIMLIFSFLISYCMVNIYNLCVGGGLLGIIDYIYPMISNEYVIGDLGEALYSGIHISAMITLVFLIGFIVSIWKWFRGQIGFKQIAICFIAMNGIGAFMYFINRSAYGNMAISGYQLIILLAVYADEIKEMVVQKEARFVYAMRKCIDYIVFGVVSIFALQGLFYTGLSINNKKDTSWNVEDLKMLASEIEGTVPKDTPAFGIGTTILYEYMGWDTVYHITDFPDLTQSGQEYVNAEMENLSAFFGEEGYIDNYSNAILFEKAEEYIIGDYMYAYYIRK